MHEIALQNSLTPLLMASKPEVRPAHYKRAGEESGPERCQTRLNNSKMLVVYYQQRLESMCGKGPWELDPDRTETLNWENLVLSVPVVHSSEILYSMCQLKTS